MRNTFKDRLVTTRAVKFLKTTALILCGARQMSLSLNNFRTILEFNKSSVSAHVGVSWWKSNVCIAYEPLGPTIKSWDGVRIGELN